MSLKRVSVKEQAGWAAAAAVGTVVASASLAGDAGHPFRDLGVKIFADGADVHGMLELAGLPFVSGLTTNPTLMKRAGVRDYEEFARQVLHSVASKPVSFEVFSDEATAIRREALRMADWGENVYVKIPVLNTRGEFMGPVIHELAQEGVKLNVTAVFSLAQVRAVAEVLMESVPAVVSVFAGRIADAGCDPEPVMRASRCLLEEKPLAEVLWASVREVYNIFQADRCGCHIVTVPNEILAKGQRMVGTDLEKLSLETVREFDRDARASGLRRQP